MNAKIGMAVLVMAAASACAPTDAPGPLAPAVVVDSRGAFTPPPPAASPTLADVALAVNAETGEFSTLIAAVVAADIVGALNARGQRTVFAPTDAAFAALGLSADNIGDIPVEALRNILFYHLTPGRLAAADVVQRTRLRMANGGTTRIRVDEEGAFINGSQIVAVDVEAMNGIIHVIDAVLLPG
jgi:uncharacterized surface protein with fasciclin (FAS1) repeats